MCTAAARVLHVPPLVRTAARVLHAPPLMPTAIAGPLPVQPRGWTLRFVGRVGLMP